MLMHDLWREYIPPVFPSNEVPFERRGKIDGVRSSIRVSSKGIFFRVGVSCARAWKKSTKDQSRVIVIRIFMIELLMMNWYGGIAWWKSGSDTYFSYCDWE